MQCAYVYSFYSLNVQWHALWAYGMNIKESHFSLSINETNRKETTWTMIKKEISLFRSFAIHFVLVRGLIIVDAVKFLCHILNVSSFFFIAICKLIFNSFRWHIIVSTNKEFRAIYMLIASLSLINKWQIKYEKYWKFASKIQFKKSFEKTIEIHYQFQRIGQTFYFHTVLEYKLPSN